MVIVPVKKERMETRPKRKRKIALVQKKESQVLLKEKMKLTKQHRK